MLSIFIPARHTLIAATLFLAVAASVFAADEAGAPGAASATVSIVLLTGDPQSGDARVLLCQSPEAYHDRTAAVRRATVAFRDGRGTVTWKDLPPGRYAVKAYFDANGNGKLDTGFMGKPVEPYGYSSNARGLIGSPSWRKVSFDLEEDASETLKIELK